MVTMPNIKNKLQTARIVKLSTSDCHNFLAVGLDLKNDENIQF